MSADTEYSSTPALSEESISIFEEMKNRLSSFERRLRAIEYPGKNREIYVQRRYERTLMLLQFGESA